MPSSWVLRLRRPSGIPLRATMAKLLMRALLTTHLPLHPRRNRHIRAHTQKHMHCLHTHISVQPLWTAQESCKAKQAHTHTSPGRIHRWASWRAIACTHIDTHRHTDTQTRTDAHRHTGAQTHSHTQAHRHTDRHTDTSMHICMETRTKSCTDTGKRVHLGVHTYTRMHALACARAHALAHTHTHIYTQSAGALTCYEQPGLPAVIPQPQAPQGGPPAASALAPAERQQQQQQRQGVKPGARERKHCTA